MENERDLAEKMQLVDSFKFLYVAYVTDVVFPCRKTLSYAILVIFGRHQKEEVRGLFSVRDLGVPQGNYTGVRSSWVTSIYPWE